MDALKELLEKIPFGALAAVAALYYGYEYYNLIEGDGSPIKQKAVEIENAKKDLEAIRKKAKTVDEFKANLEARRQVLRELAQKLEDMKATVTEQLDVPEFMKTVITEAKRVGITVIRLDPGTAQKADYYVAQPFMLAFRGVYVQLVVFLERLANVQRVVRIEQFQLKPISPAAAKYVELEGVLEIHTYKYVPSAEDNLGKGELAGGGP